MVLVLRRVQGGAEYVLFDPALPLQMLPDGYYKANKFALMQFRSDLLELLRKTIQTPLRGGWIGGNPTRFEPGWDSVQVCCEWIRLFVSETNDRDSFPTTGGGGMPPGSPGRIYNRSFDAVLRG